MPEIFTKGSKLKLIEYGSEQQGLEAVSEIKTAIQDFLKRVRFK